jgi:hypothetical protein
MGAASTVASPGGAAFNERRAYELPERLRLNNWALTGEWTVGYEKVVLDRRGVRLHVRVVDPHRQHEYME